jgi:hypothetical protein
VDPGKQVSFVDIFLVETLLSSKIHRLAKLLFGPPIACASSRWPEAASKHTADIRENLILVKKRPTVHACCHHSESCVLKELSYFRCSNTYDLPSDG